MSLYLYSLGRPNLLVGCAWPVGEEAGTIDVVEHGSLAAVVRPIDALPAPVRRSDLLHHDAVNRAVLATGLCVPMRWGTIVADHSACVRLLVEQHERWQRIAQRLQGRVELSATIVLPNQTQPEAVMPVPGEHQPGTAYLRMRQAGLAAEMARTDQARGLETTLRQALDGLADAIVIAQRGGLMTVAALVLHERFDIAAERTRTALADNPARWTIGAPWPPYSFVDEEQSALQGLL